MTTPTDKSPDPMSGERSTPETGLVEELTSTPTDTGPGPLSQLADREWQSLLDVDDRTSPEEYPDMCLITRAEFGGIISEGYFLAKDQDRDALTSKDEEVARLTRERDQTYKTLEGLTWLGEKVADAVDPSGVFHVKGLRDAAMASEARAKSAEAQVEGLKRALGKWSCKGCDGRGASYYEGQDHACRICDRSGLNPIARAALASLPQGKDQQP